MLYGSGVTEQTPTPLRAWRLARGLSIRELEKRTGINRGRLSLYERIGSAPPDDMARIIKVLGDDAA